MPINASRNYFEQCIDCKDRHVGCHAECEKYKNAQAAWQKEVEDRKKKRDSKLIVPEKRMRKMPRSVDRRK